MSFAESQVEEAALAWLAELGYTIASGPDLGLDGSAPERENYGGVVLADRVRRSIARLNPDIPTEIQDEVFRRLFQTETPSLIEENRRLHRFIIEGVPVEFTRADGTIGGDSIRLIDFADPDANEWLALSQFTVIENGANRRPDVVIFINGLPIGVIELKNPGSENATLDGAYRQLQTYKKDIPALFRTNAVLVISDGLAARIGSLTANRERFMPWRTIDGSEIAPRDVPELETLLKGACERRRFLDLIKDFTVFGQIETKDRQLETIKIIAGYHQYHAVKRAVASTLRALAPEPAPACGFGEEPARYGLPDAALHPPGDKRIGVIWHTQGSGKSLLMAFYAGRLVRTPKLENPTIVVITDRNDLDDQLFGTFSMCRDLIRQTPQQAGDRDALRRLLDRSSGGVIFTTIQKFSPEDGRNDYPLLTDRRNVIVIADEAHRSQYGFGAKVDRKTAAVSYGFAKYLRDALPNASFIGFTGTPIEKDDVSTPAVFGDYIDIYDISRAVEDGATVPIYYESRLARIELDADERPKIDAEIAAIIDEDAEP
ncbi:MAG: type I restriction endonuclease subunit R, partial [Acetobacteraceae bacterium]